MQQNTRNHATQLETHTPPILNVARRLEVLYQQIALIDQRDWCAEISDLEDEITDPPAVSRSQFVSESTPAARSPPRCM